MVSGHDYNDVITTLVWVAPVTSVDRAWDNQVELHGSTGLPQASFAMTEQLRVISRSRLDGLLGVSTIQL